MHQYKYIVLFYLNGTYFYSGLKCMRVSIGIRKRFSKMVSRATITKSVHVLQLSRF